MSELDLTSIDPKKLDNEQFQEVLQRAVADGADVTAVDPATFSRLIGRASKSQIAAVMSSPARKKLLDTVFERFNSQFRPERAGSTSAVMLWRIGDRSDGDYDRYELEISDGSCSVTDQPGKEPRATLTMGAGEFLKLVSGNGSPPVMFMTGKLKVKGDLGFAAGLINYFEMPQAQ